MVSNTLQTACRCKFSKLFQTLFKISIDLGFPMLDKHRSIDFPDTEMRIDGNFFFKLCFNWQMDLYL